MGLFTFEKGAPNSNADVSITKSSKKKTYDWMVKSMVK